MAGIDAEITRLLNYLSEILKINFQNPEGSPIHVSSDAFNWMELLSYFSCESNVAE